VAEQYTDPARDAEALAEALYREHGWSGCAGSAWANLPDGAKDGWRFAARVRAETLAEVGRKVYDLPTTRTQAWRNGWNSVSLNDVLGIVRGMAEAGEQ
jgi:hypothetical protein